MSAHTSPQPVPPPPRVRGRGAVLGGKRDEVGPWTPPVIARRHYTQLAIHPLAPSFARSHVERVLADLNQADLTSTAQLIASELVTNAIQASGLRLPTDEELERYGMFAAADLACIWIGLYPVAGGVVLEVWDHSRQPPRLTTATLDDLGGRGLFLVDALAQSWGYHWPKTGGKIVWAQLSSDPVSPETEVSRATETVR